MTVVELHEWQDRFLPDTWLGERDRRLVGSLQGVHIREMRNGLHIQALSWIGMVQFESFTLRIRPKLTNVDVMRMLILAGGLESLSRYNAKRRYVLEQTDVTLFDLVAMLLADAAKAITNGGLLRGYVVEEEDLPVMRGRLRTLDQVRQRYGQVDRLECRYEDFHADVVENQILHTALNLCRRYVRHPAVRKRLQGLLDVFAVSSSPLQREWRVVRSEMVYNRLNKHYQEAHALAWMVFEGLNVKDIMAAGNPQGFAFLLDMNPLFEKFTEVLVRAALRHEPITVQVQLNASGHIWDTEQNRTYKRLRPDLLLTRDDGLQLAVDAKYKRYDTKKLDEADIYQTFLYTQAFRNAVTGDIPGALLIHPADFASQSPRRLHIRNNVGVAQARLHALGVDIPGTLDALFSADEDTTNHTFTELRDEIGQLLEDKAHSHAGAAQHL